ncbi:type VII toxin-antitoxin system HepT family RNase toxin [Chondromyces crocatus]|uniref:DUF86 domain-containing protein n=1 Tax=Chondromyces crocatus TaxID=52 RepID=A0A0K1ELX9_CHOCO|nr:HepT-like ribonuclease domain-containing protein [Chondromyces crocatus]AKT41667.1 uncharacterized protein CMC5_058730 [Chondromyces crocatus]
MVNRDLVAAKLAELDDRIARIRAKCPATSALLSTDRDALDLVSFNLMLAVQSCSDIASHLIADEGWPAANHLAACFNRLRDEGVLSATTAASLGRAVGLRNVVAHGDSGINPAMVHAAATQGARDLEAFAREVAVWLAQRHSP